MTPTRTESWAVARVLSDQPLNGELQAASKPIRRLVDHLESLPLEGRLAAFQAFACAYDDADRIIKAVASVDPTSRPPEGETVDRPRFKLTRASDVEVRPTDWLWRDRVPRGMLTLFAGDPKLGKSFVTVGIAAAVSRGVALPGDGPPEGPGSVILLSAEDDVARTIVPRLAAAGAVRDRVHILESVYLSDGSEALPSLRVDVGALESAIRGVGDCRLVVVDPVSAYLGGVDDHRNAELRGVLSPLRALAERTDVAVILVTHLNKSAGTNGKHRVTGSIAYVGACRANFLFVRDRSDSRRVLMLPNGCNLADDPPTLAYRIVDRGYGPTVEWEADPVPITAEQALAADAEPPHERGERDECDAWLREVLSCGRVLQRDIAREGRDAGFTPKQLEASKRRLGARSQREGFGPGSTCYWTLEPRGLAAIDPRIDAIGSHPRDGGCMESMWEPMEGSTDADENIDRHPPERGWSGAGAGAAKDADGWARAAQKGGG